MFHGLVEDFQWDLESGWETPEHVVVGMKTAAVAADVFSNDSKTKRHRVSASKDSSNTLQSKTRNTDIPKTTPTGLFSLEAKCRKNAIGVKCLERCVLKSLNKATLGGLLVCLKMSSFNKSLEAFCKENRVVIWRVGRTQNKLNLTPVIPMKKVIDDDDKEEEKEKEGKCNRAALHHFFVIELTDLFGEKRQAFYKGKK